MTNWKWKKLQLNLDRAEKEQANRIIPTKKSAWHLPHLATPADGMIV
jgi:hypothetical protein